MKGFIIKSDKTHKPRKYMAKFNNPVSYAGRQANQNLTGQARFANDTEAAAGEAENLIISPATLASAVDDLVPDATTTSKGKVELATLTELQTGTAPAGAWVPTANDVATVIAAVVVGAVPPATTTQQGIVELATDAQVVTPFTTDVPNTAVQPSNITAMFAAPPAIGGTTPAGGTFTFVAASATGTGNVLTSDTASSFGTTGAGVDVTIASASGRAIINGEEAAANAITLLSAAGGIDVDAALQINIASSQNAADAIRINASAGGIDVDAVGAAGEDINITNTGGSVVIVATESAADSVVIQSTAGGIDILASGAAAGEDIDITATGSSVNITSTENNSGAVIVRANGGTSERVTLLASQGTGADSINLESTAGGITLSAALATADGINLAASAGGIDIDGALQVNIASSQNAVDAIRIVASAGGIDIDAVGAATEDINITNTGGSIVLSATESAADSIKIESTAGGIDILASGAAAGEDIDIIATGSSVNITSTESAADSIVITSSAGGIDILASGAAAGEDIDIVATGSSVNVSATEDVADAIVLSASAGGIDILATGAATQDIDIVNTGGSVNISATENDAGAITVGTNGGTSERITVTCAQGTNAASIALTSTAGGITFTAGLATDDAFNIVAGSGGIDVDVAGEIDIVTTEANADSINVTSAGGIDITATGAAAKDIDIVCTSGSINLTAGENIATSMVITNTGMDIAITGAAGQDFDLTNTGGSVNITATENVSDAIIINASGAASGMTLDCGTASLTIGTGMKHAVTSVATAASPYTVLGTDYFISTDSTGGAMTITLPAVPGTGRKLVVYDGTGQAATGGNVTIDGNGNNIAAAGTSAATKLINTAYESYILTFNGTIWCGQNIV